MAQALAVVQQVFQTQAVGQAILAAQPIPPSLPPGAPTPPGPGDGQPNATGPLTTIQTSDMSSVHVTVDVTTTGTATSIVVPPLPAGVPVAVPLVLTQAPFQPTLPTQQSGLLVIAAQPTNDLIEATKVSPGVSAAVAVLTVQGDSPKYNTAALLADHFQDIGGGIFIKSGTFGTVVLDTLSDTVSFILDNTRSVTKALGEGDTEHESIRHSSPGQQWRERKRHRHVHRRWAQ